MACHQPIFSIYWCVRPSLLTCAGAQINAFSTRLYGKYFAEEPRVPDYKSLTPLPSWLVPPRALLLIKADKFFKRFWGCDIFVWICSGLVRTWPEVVDVRRASHTQATIQSATSRRRSTALVRDIQPPHHPDIRMIRTNPEQDPGWSWLAPVLALAIPKSSIAVGSKWPIRTPWHARYRMPRPSTVSHCMALSARHSHATPQVWHGTICHNMARYGLARARLR